MLLGLFALCIVVMRCFLETPLARVLNDALVARPLAWLSRLKRRDIIFALLIVGLFIVAGDFIAIFGAGELVMLGMNLSIYLDAVLVATAVTIAAATATVWRAARVHLSMWFARIGQARRGSNRPKKPQRASADDDDEPAWAAAFAV
jgi:hypothetical protein